MDRLRRIVAVLRLLDLSHGGSCRPTIIVTSPTRDGSVGARSSLQPPTCSRQAAPGVRRQRLQRPVQGFGPRVGRLRCGRACGCRHPVRPDTTSPDETCGAHTCSTMKRSEPVSARLGHHRAQHYRGRRSARSQEDHGIRHRWLAEYSVVKVLRVLAARSATHA